MRTQDSDIKRLALDITLTEETVLSSHAGSSNQRETLDYIPGANLLGAAAARLYRELQPAQSRWLFHSGEVRFGDARLLAASDRSAVPSPLSFDHPKAQLAIVKGALVGIRDRACLGKEEKGIQRKSLESLEIDPVTGVVLTPAKLFRQKTATSPSTSIAADSMLFGYQSLPSGLRLRAHIVAKVTALGQEEILKIVREKLAGALRFGKSRSAQYGSARVEAASEWEDVPPLTTSAANTITLHLLSDLSVCDEMGQPTLTPLPQHLGLPPGRRVPERCFVQTRRYSPYNGYYRSQDTERVVLRRGSVLSFEFDQTPDDLFWRGMLNRLQCGLGDYRAYGLGEVALGTPDMAGWELQRSRNAAASLAQQSAALRPTHELIEWLEQADSNAAERNRDSVHDELKTLQHLYLEIKRFHGHATNEDFGPSRSQWGVVLATARASNEVELRELLISLRDDTRDSAWKYALPGSAETSVSFISWLIKKADHYPIAVIAQIAHGAQRADIRGVKQ